MRILVFGKTGQVANNLQKLSGQNFDIIAVGRLDADLSVAGRASEVINETKPEVVINAAAYTAVDRAESEPDLAMRINADAPAEMAAATKSQNAHFIHISTDYVFDGKSKKPYLESDTPNPLNVYGASKLHGERRVLDMNAHAVILRTSWVFSDTGANFVKSMLNLANSRDELTIVDDQIGGPTAAADIAKALLSIASSKQNGSSKSGLYHFQGAPSSSWAEFANFIFEQARKPVRVIRIPTTDYPTPARRPLRTILDCSKIERDFDIRQPDWRPALCHVIGELESGVRTS